MTTIVEFLLARIAEDEEVARGATHPGADEMEWHVDGTWWLEGVKHDVVGPDEVAFTHPGMVDHIARHDPARVLAECQAKRAIIAERTCGCPDPDCDDCGACSGNHHADPTPAPCATIRHLATVYADHPDYREEWRP